MSASAQFSRITECWSKWPLSLTALANQYTQSRIPDARQAQHIINDNSPSQWQEHIWQLLLMAVIFTQCQPVMFKVGFICWARLTQVVILHADLVKAQTPISPSHAFLLEFVLAVHWLKEWYYSCSFFIVVVFQREPISKAIFLLREQIVHGKL